MHPKLCHSRVCERVSRNTLGMAKMKRDCHIYADFARILVSAARDLHVGIDSGGGTQTSHLCARLHSARLLPLPLLRGILCNHKGATTLYALLSLSGSIRCFIRIADGETYYTNILEGPRNPQRLPDSLPCINPIDGKTDKRKMLLPNKTSLPALVIPQICKKPMTSRTLLQTARTSPAGRGTLWHIREHSHNSNSARLQPHQNPAISQHSAFWGKSIFAKNP